MHTEQSTVDAWAKDAGLDANHLKTVLTPFVPQGETLENWIRGRADTVARIMGKRFQGPVHVGAT